jgi:hypothetical protein
MADAGVKRKGFRQSGKGQRKFSYLSKWRVMMSERLKWFLWAAWLLAGFFLLALPVFLPSYPGALVTPIGISTAAMFVLSFPASLLSPLLSPIAGLILGVNQNSIAGAYINLNVLFLLGAVQWLVVVPRFLRGKRATQVSETLILPEYVQPIVEAFDSESRTPVERVFDDEK